MSTQGRSASIYLGGFLESHLGKSVGQEVSGYFHFKEEGKVEIQAFGHAQSALLSDTTRHTAPWFVQGSELIIGNSHPLTYQVISQSPTHVRLLLLEEIQVSLIRTE